MPISLTDDRITFKAVQNKDGLNYVPPEVEDLIDQFMTDTGRTVTYLQGNFQTLSYVFTPPLTPEEITLWADKLGIDQ